VASESLASGAKNEVKAGNISPVAYTSVGATLRDYTVVIPVDTTAAATGYETVIGFYHLLNQAMPTWRTNP
jgi:hypothetical protein